MVELKTFTEIEDKDLFESYGGKGAQLIALAKAGLPVPKGFCVPVSEYDSYLDESSKEATLDRLVEQIQNVMETFGTGVAIRSSANFEDGENSFAGIFESVYVVEDEAHKIRSAIERVYRSVSSKGAIDYYQQHNINIGDIKMGLVVQELVPYPDQSGVMFVQQWGGDQESLIHYAEGYGESIVSAQKLGHKYVKSKGRVSHVKNPTEPATFLSQDQLNDLHEYAEIAKRVIDVEDIDLEFAIHSREIKILQARELTEKKHIDHNLNSFSVLNPGVVEAQQGDEIVVVNAQDFLSADGITVDMDKLIDKVVEYKSTGSHVLLATITTDNSFNHFFIKNHPTQIIGLIAQTASEVSHASSVLAESDAHIPGISGAQVSKIETGTKIKKFDAAGAQLFDYESCNLLVPLFETPLSQEEVLAAHLKSAERFVVPQDLGQNEALRWIQASLESALLPDESQSLLDIILTNLPSQEVNYAETGMDSNQSNRKLAKIAAEAILLGGILSEEKLMGSPKDISYALGLINSELIITDEQAEVMAKLAKSRGKSQQFLFPGLTPTPGEELTLEKLAKAALEGNPIISVRSLTGVGGLRFDKEWNHATDFRMFIELKLQEDKRYYPGIAIVNKLIHTENILDIPIVAKIKAKSEMAFEEILQLQSALISSDSVDVAGSAILCSAYIPKEGDLEILAGAAPLDSTLDLNSAFHSPSDKFIALYDALQYFNASGDISGVIASTKSLKKASNKLFSFNSTIHLPWADGFSHLANGLFGIIKNEQGFSANRFGIGFEETNKSAEVVEYNLNGNGKYYVLKIYQDSHLFDGDYSEIILDSEHELWDKIDSEGLFKTLAKFFNII